MYGGLSNLGEGAAKAVAEMRKAQEDESADNIIIEHAKQTGQLTPEQYTQFINGSRTQKNGIVAGLARNLAMILAQQKQLADERELALRYRGLNRDIAAQFNWTPDEAAKQAARWTNNELVKTGPGRYTLAPYSGNGQDQVVTDPLVISGQTIPGIGVNRKTGQYVYFGGMQGGGLQVELDPKTGTPFYRDAKGNPKPLSGQQIMAGQMLPSQIPAPTPQTGGGVSDILNNIFGGVWRNTNGGPPPTATVTPTPPPAVTTPAPSAAPATAAASARSAKKLDKATAMQFLAQAGGDKEKARELARAAGYVF